VRFPQARNSKTAQVGDRVRVQVDDNQFRHVSPPLEVEP
jgi:hypothetical protein